MMMSKHTNFDMQLCINPIYSPTKKTITENFYNIPKDGQRSQQFFSYDMISFYATMYAIYTPTKIRSYFLYYDAMMKHGLP